MKDLRVIANTIGISMSTLERALDDLKPESYTAAALDEASRIYAVSSGEQQRAAAMLWNQLAMREVEHAVTLDEMLLAYHRARFGSEAQRAAIRKIYSLFPEMEPALA